MAVLFEKFLFDWFYYSFSFCHECNIVTFGWNDSSYNLVMSLSELYKNHNSTSCNSWVPPPPLWLILLVMFLSQACPCHHCIEWHERVLFAMSRGAVQRNRNSTLCHSWIIPLVYFISVVLVWSKTLLLLVGMTWHFICVFLVMSWRAKYKNQYIDLMPFLRNSRLIDFISAVLVRRLNIALSPGWNYSNLICWLWSYFFYICWFY